MASPYLITGCVGGVHPRLEIQDLHDNHPEQFTLFILGWDKIRDKDHSPMAAQFVQQAGIHGLPYERWPGDPTGYGGKESEVKRWHGYCNHESPLFPTWHRPSLMLLEQSICETTSEIATALTQNHPDEQKKWQEAAKALRFPYWDWTAEVTGKKGLPRIFSRSNLHLKMPGPGNPTKTHPNILAFYSFDLPLPPGFDNRIPDVPDAQMSYFKEWDRTYRWPESEAVDPKEDIERINQLLTGTNTDGKKWGWRDLTSKVALLFGFRNDIQEDLHANVWDEVSNTTFQSATRDADGRPVPPHAWGCGSIESPHNLVHLLLGGSGNMGDNDYASFDPIFFLHHANIDRILAFWEHVYPDYYIGENGYLSPDGQSRRDFTQPNGSWSQPEDNPVVKSSTALAPFRGGDKEYWTSATVHSLNDKYYTYPPILDPKGENDVKLGEKVSAEKREKQRAVLQKHFQHDPVKFRLPYLDIGDPFEELDDVKTDSGYEKVYNYRQFVVSVLLPPFAHGGSYYLDVFCGKQHVGSAAVLGRAKDTQCEACQGRRAAGVLAYSVVVIPHDIVIQVIREDKTPGRPVADKVKLAIRAEIVLANGQKVGRTSQTAPARNSALSEEKTPKLWLHSAGAQALKDSTNKHEESGPQRVPPVTPYESYSRKDHGLVPAHWALDVPS